MVEPFWRPRNSLPQDCLERDHPKAKGLARLKIGSESLAEVRIIPDGTPMIMQERRANQGFTATASRGYDIFVMEYLRYRAPLSTGLQDQIQLVVSRSHRL
ncbi:hypothetical protein [Microvirga sp. M2]|uniref:hypothetical protein n=1 Tax=Microvirga sp. M2 TaxID=3073270 RepID=UPI0039C3DCBE